MSSLSVVTSRLGFKKYQSSHTNSALQSRVWNNLDGYDPYAKHSNLGRWIRPWLPPSLLGRVGLGQVRLGYSPSAVLRPWMWIETVKITTHSSQCSRVTHVCHCYGVMLWQILLCCHCHSVMSWQILLCCHCYGVMLWQILLCCHCYGVMLTDIVVLSLS